MIRTDCFSADNLYTSQKQTLQVNEGSVKLAIKCMASKKTGDKKQKPSKALQPSSGNNHRTK